MVFNIVVIIGLVVQGIIILSLLHYCTALSLAFSALSAYFQTLATDLGYPKIVDLPDDTEELNRWASRRKKQNEEN